MRYCCVIRCSDGKAKTDCRDKTFFKFHLKNSQLLQIWLKNIGRQGFMQSSSCIIFSDHFEENSYTTIYKTQVVEARSCSYLSSPKQIPIVGLPSSATDGNNMQPDGKKQGVYFSFT
ncbi:hypothetical protein AVEN_211434-1 [Araneus ventricosus]|uniref:THAP-type domain-containing protein n=1 Tax=Araneus ventricosus TaxID=182803 RepID=A0A4Y2KNG2_ARAVE|nr:hypothetical protein AVEN_211434-1 [Araneus ventricosus]